MVKKAANNSSSTPVLMGFNSNEGFLTLMQFLTKEFPTEKLHTEGFSSKMAMKMISKMFPSLAAESHKVIKKNRRMAMMKLQIVESLKISKLNVEGDRFPLFRVESERRAEGFEEVLESREDGWRCSVHV